MKNKISTKHVSGICFIPTERRDRRRGDLPNALKI